MRTLSDFKNELRLHIGSRKRKDKIDPWGYAMGAWFTLCAVMDYKGYDIPNSWQYVGRGVKPDKEDTFYYYFKRSDERHMLEVGNFLDRYTAMLKRNDRDY